MITKTSTPDCFTKMYGIEEEGKVIRVPIDWIRLFPGQPRKHFDQQELKDLAASLKAVGQQIPGSVREVTDQNAPFKYELIDGERRWRALKMAGIPKMKVIALEVADDDAQFLISVVSNFGRAPHQPQEIANAIARFQQSGLPTSRIAEIFGKSETWVSQHIRILKLHPNVQKMMSAETPEENRLTLLAGLLLVNFPLLRQEALAEAIVKEQMKLIKAKHFISEEGKKIGVQKSNPDRTPSKDWRSLRLQLRRIRTECELWEQMPQSFFVNMFRFRSKEDQEIAMNDIRTTIMKLESVLMGIKRAK